MEFITNGAYFGMGYSNFFHAAARKLFVKPMDLHIGRVKNLQSRHAKTTKILKLGLGCESYEILIVSSYNETKCKLSTK